MPDQTPYTPSAEEIARTILPMFDQLATAVYHDGPYSEAGSAMDAATALMPLVKRAQAEALREAANVAEDWVAADGMNGGEWMPSQWGNQAKGWLMHRARRIEQGETDD